MTQLLHRSVQNRTASYWPVLTFEQLLGDARSWGLLLVSSCSRQPTNAVAINSLQCRVGLGRSVARGKKLGQPQLP